MITFKDKSEVQESDLTFCDMVVAWVVMACFALVISAAMLAGSVWLVVQVLRWTNVL